MPEHGAVKQSALRLATIAGALALAPAAAKAVSASSIQAGCHADRRSCHVRVDPFAIPIGSGQNLEQVEVRLNGATVYDFRSDVSNPPSGSYAPTLPFPGFAARCKATYVASVRAKDTADAELVGVGESAPFTCPPAAACPATASASCIGAARASLVVNEAKTGREKLEASLAGFAEDTTSGKLGDPVAGDTLYDLCVYDGAGTLAASLSVDEAGSLCGPAQRPCWKTKPNGSFAYKDPAGASDGVVKIGVKGGPAGKGKVLVQASNDAKASRTALPTGIAASLEGSTTATLQLHASGAECFSAELTSVKKADGTRFKAIAP